MQGSYLVCAISSDHVQNGVFTSRVVWDPCIGLDNLSVQYEDLSAVCDEPLNLPSRPYAVFGGHSGGHVVVGVSGCVYGIIGWKGTTAEWKRRCYEVHRPRYEGHMLGGLQVE